MAEIKVNAMQLKNVAGQLNQLNQQFKKEINDLNTCQQKLNSMWDGEANEKFNAAYRTDSQKMTTFAQTIDKYIQTLEQIAANYQKAEGTNTGIAGH